MSYPHLPDAKPANAHPATPCCNHLASADLAYPVMWNPWTHRVQCHHCGAIYVPPTSTQMETRITAAGGRANITGSTGAKP
jgi:ribosomal protein S27E